MSRYRVTQTRQVVVDISKEDIYGDETDGDVALALADDLPDREWDTLDRVVEAL